MIMSRNYVLQWYSSAAVFLFIQPWVWFVSRVLLWLIFLWYLYVIWTPEMNVSSFSVILIFTPYDNMGFAKNMLLTLVFILYLFSIIANIILLSLIYLDASLHKPMYIFLFSLILNGLIGSSAVWPKVMNILITDDNTSSYAGCIIQMFLIRCYGACNYSMLSVMACDRFISIFKPLRYHSIMHPCRVRHLVLIGNLIPCSFAIWEAYFILQIPLCRYTIDRIFCDNLSISVLSCEGSQSQLANTFSLCGIICCVVVPAFLFILSYLKIILLILKLSAEARRKTFSTCTPHLVFFATFSVAALFSVAFNRFNPHVPAKVKVIRVFFLATNSILIPPLVHPMIYGIKNTDIRTSFQNMKRRINLQIRNIIHTWLYAILTNDKMCFFSCSLQYAKLVFSPFPNSWQNGYNCDRCFSLKCYVLPWLWLIWQLAPAPEAVGVGDYTFPCICMYSMYSK